jgi:hypothetical protein
VLVGAQGIGSKIGAGAKIVADAGAANGNPVAIIVFRIENLEFGKDRVIAEVPDAEFLLAAELPAQFDLPVLERQIVGPVQPR